MSLERTFEFSDFQINFELFTSRLIESLEVFNKRVLKALYFVLVS